MKTVRHSFLESFNHFAADDFKAKQLLSINDGVEVAQALQAANYILGLSQAVLAEVSPDGREMANHHLTSAAYLLSDISGALITAAIDGLEVTA